mmetsp:Transcript_48197/g.111701  ORF Transcript_48197/g.111701 Transcript_48197/m.111701 type:complete len:335 (-) Transcript_48197:37-1041(-)
MVLHDSLGRDCCDHLFHCPSLGSQSLEPRLEVPMDDIKADRVVHVHWAHKHGEAVAGEAQCATVRGVLSDHLDDRLGQSSLPEGQAVLVGELHEGLHRLQCLLCDLCLARVLIHEPHSQVHETLFCTDVLVTPAARGEAKERLFHWLIAPVAVLAMEMVLDVLDEQMHASELPQDGTVLVAPVQEGAHSAAKRVDLWVVNPLAVGRHGVVQHAKAPSAQAVLTIEEAWPRERIGASNLHLFVVREPLHGSDCCLQGACSHCLVLHVHLGRVGAPSKIPAARELRDAIRGVDLHIMDNGRELWAIPPLRLEGGGLHEKPSTGHNVEPCRSHEERS